MSIDFKFDDAYYMHRALQEAETAFEKGEVPIGAIIVVQDRIIARAHNLTEQLNDVTPHAEMQAITAAANFMGGKYLNDCTLYVTLEPCVMCAGAIYWSGIGRVVYGCSALQLEEQVSGPGGFDVPIRQLYGMARPGSRCIEIVGPLLAEEGIQVHKDSGIWKK